MSQVKFEETIRTTQQSGGNGGARGGGKQDFAHQIGNAITKDVDAGGYLAVSASTGQPESKQDKNHKALTQSPTVVPEEATRGPSSHKDAHLWLSRRPARATGVLDSQRP